MADGTFVEALARQVAQPALVDVNGVPILTTPNGWNALDTRQPNPGPEPLELNTLRGLSEYLARNVDAVEKAELMLHVESPVSVHLFSKAETRFYTRKAWAVANCSGLTLSERHPLFGSYCDAEDFIIWLQTMFANSDDRARVLAIVGNIREENVRNTADDGVTQVVTAKAGIALNAEVKVPNPVTLRPYRTFREVEQPASSFILRMRQRSGAGPLAALFEADGASWKLEAMSNVAAYLKDNASGVAIIY